MITVVKFFILKMQENEAENTSWQISIRAGPGMQVPGIWGTIFALGGWGGVDKVAVSVGVMRGGTLFSLLWVSQ